MGAAWSKPSTGMAGGGNSVCQFAGYISVSETGEPCRFRTLNVRDTKTIARSSRLTVELVD